MRPKKERSPEEERNHAPCIEDIHPVRPHDAGPGDPGRDWAGHRIQPSVVVRPGCAVTAAYRASFAWQPRPPSGGGYAVLRMIFRLRAGPTSAGKSVKI